MPRPQREIPAGTCRYSGVPLTRTEIQLSDGSWCDERWVCHHCLTDDHAVVADEQYSFGIYAGRWCEECWPQSGYRDAGGPMGDPAELEAMGEVIEPEVY